MLSPDGTFDELYISNYTTTRIKDVLARINGVSKVEVFGAKDFGMRVWINPDRLRARGLTTSDLTNALREQNVQVAAGQIGGQPAPKDQPFEYSISTLGRLQTVEQFENIIVKRGEQGQLVRVRDVARVELGAQSYKWFAKLDGAPSIAVAVYPLPAPTRSTWPRASRPSWIEAPKGLSRRSRGPHPLRHHRIHSAIAQRGRDHPDHRHPVGGLHGLHLPPGFPHHPGPGHHHSGVPARHLRGHARARSVHQRAHHVRVDSGDRHRRRRRHRGGGKHHANHRHRRSRCQGGHRQINGRDHRSGGRDDSGSARGLCSHYRHARYHRPPLPPIRDHHFGGDPLFFTQRVDPQPGPVRHAAAALGGTQEGVLRALQPDTGQRAPRATGQSSNYCSAARSSRQSSSVGSWWPRTSE